MIYLLTSLLALASVTPPLPVVDGLCRPTRCRSIVVSVLLGDIDVQWRVERDEGEVGQVNLMNLVEYLLALIGVSSGLLSDIQLVQIRIAIEQDVEAVGRDLVGGRDRSIIGIIAKRLLKLGDVIF